MSPPSGSDPDVSAPGRPPEPGMRDPAPELPMALKLVALLCILAGIVSLSGSVIRALDGHVYLSVELLCIPAGIGLLKRREGWRTFALVMTGVGLLVSMVVLLVFLLMSEPPALRMFGMGLPEVPDIVIVLSAFTLFLGLIWQFRVLIRTDVCAAFRARRDGGRMN